MSYLLDNFNKFDTIRLYAPSNKPSTKGRFLCQENGLNIYKRKDGRWEARYIKSRNALGKPKYGYLYASSYREVRCDLQHTLQLQGKPSGSEERTRNSTFELVSMEWLDAFSINFKESTYIRYRTLIECYLMPSFQTVKIEKITKEMVRKLCKHLELHGKRIKPVFLPRQSRMCSLFCVAF